MRGSRPLSRTHGFTLETNTLPQIKSYNNDDVVPTSSSESFSPSSRLSAQRGTWTGWLLQETENRADAVGVMSARVGPHAGPDPYNVNSIKGSFGTHDNRRAVIWNSPQPRMVDNRRDGWLNPSPSFCQARQPFHSGLRNNSNLQKHTSVASPTRQRHAKSIQDYRSSDLRSNLNFKGWVKPAQAASMRGSITNNDPFKR
mmetsp:Transcript_8505/g.11483  ORF Transcript_8505/g.11483 Transcript_8505/m.11483 type:complete len:200 (-) Transcript_8505:1316-1915(-)